ncbi:enoyl-CoA hydratase/isomerase family protein [Erwinia sp. S43]|uniref:enoyl-CoA hydratase/isomerase family protein n=1 Tax=Erwinia sp. S43 TaxID=2769339 RepID=UPI00190C7088|nr:enoyl-CoA hydratase/isomerase family protein [Erwinia sp. S43]MBK0035833.1 enoyl-CoA hydratase/isomerase family protein [Erwinia sp. S43]
MIADEPLTRFVLADRPASHVLCLTLHRPSQRNAYNAMMIAELEQWLDYSEQNPEIWTVILTGSGSAFCSGADLQEAFIDGGKKVRNRCGGYNPLQHQPRRKIWIAALNGHAVGGGLEMALNCDFIVAGEQVKIALPEVTHGLLPLGGAIGQLAARLPVNIARELLLTGEAIDAPQALALGLFNQLTAHDDLKDAALALAARINRSAPLAVQACNALLKQHLRTTADGEDTQQSSPLPSTDDGEETHSLPSTGEDSQQKAPLPSADEVLRQLQQSEDYQESLRAFSERRPPQWRGR